MTHGEGFGIGWYGERAESGVYREVMPAWRGAVDAMQEVLHDTMTLVRGHGTVIASEPLDDEARGSGPLPAGAVVTI